jgi:hypothetical protein
MRHAQRGAAMDTAAATAATSDEATTRKRFLPVAHNQGFLSS